jgi:hypothetical protein
MSILDGSASPQAEAAGSGPPNDRLRVITAGSVGNMEARLGTSGFDIVAAADTEDALIDAVSVDEPDAIVVEADLCDSLEHVRDLAPDAVLIAVGDHTPAGALGRVERGMSGTAMAGLLHALVAEGVGAAVVWGLVPTFRAGALDLPQRVGLSLLSANADLIRTHLANALRDPAQLVTAAGTVALTVSASLLVTFSAPRTHDRPDPVPVPASTMERAQQPPVAALSPSARTPAQSASRSDGQADHRRGPNRDAPGDHHGRHADQWENQSNNDHGGNQGSIDLVDNHGHADHGENHGHADHHGENHGHADQSENEDKIDQGENKGNADQGEGNSDEGENEGNNDQAEDNNDQREGNTDRAENKGGPRPQTTAPSEVFEIAPLGSREGSGA